MGQFPASLFLDLQKVIQWVIYYGTQPQCLIHHHFRCVFDVGVLAGHVVGSHGFSYLPHKLVHSPCPAMLVVHT